MEYEDLNNIFKAETISEVDSALNVLSSINTRDEFGRAPLHVAIQRIIVRENAINEALEKTVRELEINRVELILSKGADINATTSYYGLTPMHYAVRDIEVVKILLAHGADVNIADAESKTLLIESLQGPEPTDTSKLLIEVGANVNAFDEYGLTPLILAAKQGFTEYVQLLLEYGADPHFRAWSAGAKGKCAYDVAKGPGIKQILKKAMSDQLPKEVYARGGIALNELKTILTPYLNKKFKLGRETVINSLFFEPEDDMIARLFWWPDLSETFKEKFSKKMKRVLNRENLIPIGFSGDEKLDTKKHVEDIGVRSADGLFFCDLEIGNDKKCPVFHWIFPLDSMTDCERMASDIKELMH